MCSSSMFRFSWCVFCSISLLFDCMCIRCHEVHGPLRECLRARHFRATLSLRTTCVHSCCNWRASCVAAKLTHTQKWVLGTVTPSVLSIVGVPSGLALPGFHMFENHFYAFLSAVIGGLVVWWHNKPKPSTWGLAVWRHNKAITNKYRQ